MSKCVICGGKDATYIYSEGGYVCDDCIGKCFICPDCGKVFPRDTGDAGNGYCIDCDENH